MKKEVHQAVFGIVFDEARTQVLLIKRRDIPVWVLPGGGLEPGEPPESGACREVLEETGYKVVVLRKVAEYLPVNRLTQLSHLFECRIVGGCPQTGAETAAVSFFPISTLPRLLPPPYGSWIRDAMQKDAPLLRKEIEGVSYWVLVKLLLQHPILVGRYLLTKLGFHLNT